MSENNITTAQNPIPSQFLIYSDGGSSADGIAGSAAIVTDDKGLKKKLVAYLGKASAAEAELVGGLLGFDYIVNRLNVTNSSVLWLCDNQTVIKTASELLPIWQQQNWRTNADTPVKNLELWKAYLHLTKHLTVTTQYVAAHSGNKRNVACDHACCWMIEAGEKLLCQHGESLIGRNKTLDPANAWELYDGKKLISRICGVTC